MYFVIVHQQESNEKWHVVDSKTEAGMLLTAYNSMDAARQARLLGYAEAPSRLKEQKGNE